jgi:ankyrin repeat protein
MLAAYYGHADLVKLLIEHGADPNRLNDKGQSPIAGAVFKKADGVIEVSLSLLSHSLAFSHFAPTLPLFFQRIVSEASLC